LPCKQVALATKNAEFEVYTEVHKNLSTANDNVKRFTLSRPADALDIESCKRSINSFVARRYVPIMQQTSSLLPSFLSDALATTSASTSAHSSNKKPIQTLIASGVLGMKKTPALTQEAVVVNQLLNQEPNWQTPAVIKAGFVWGGLLGMVLHPAIGLMGAKIKHQCIQTSQTWRKEAATQGNKNLASASKVLHWLGYNTPYVNVRNVNSWGLTAIKGGFLGGLLGIGLAWGAMSQVKQGLQSFEADAQDNTNLLKTATWQHKVSTAFNQAVQPNSVVKQPAYSTKIQQEEADYHTWRKQVFSRSHTFKTMLASGLIYSLVTLGLNALGSKLLFNQLTKTNWAWQKWFKQLEQAYNHTIVLGEKRPILKPLRPIANLLPNVKNGQFQLKTVITTLSTDFSRWLRVAFKMNKPPTDNPTQDPTPKLLAYLEKSQGAFFVNLAIARYHPVALLQLFVIAAIASAVMTVQNKRLIKQVEQTVHSQAGTLPTQLDKLTAEDKQRISKIKALKKSVSDVHFSNSLV
jgi:hypothetical protein